MRGNYRLRRFHRYLHSTTTYTNPNPNPQLIKNPQPANDSDIFKWNKSITTHMRNAQVKDALGVFNSMPRRSVVSYNSMISGYLMNRMFDKARKLFDEMPERDLFSWNLMLSGYVRNRNLSDACDLFERMPERDSVSWNTMLSGYAQNGFVDEAREVFDRMPCKNGISWNGLLAAYILNGRIEEAKSLFESKTDWEIVSWNCLMGGLVTRKRLADARGLFDRIPEKDEVSWNTMISGYAQNGELEEARRLFEKSPVRDVFSWTAMISGYVQNGMLNEARSIFDEMPEKNSISWNAMIAGYVQSKKMDNARELFEAMPSRDISSWNTMITGYSQIGDIDQAKRLFDKMPQRDSISWSAMIAGYEQNGCREEALRLFVEMKKNGERLIRSSFTCVLAACGNLASMELGRQVHCLVVKAGYLTGYYVGNALLAMYCKCGSISEAHDVFQEIIEKDVVSWNTMIYGYARHGFGQEALKVFESMKTAGGAPDDATMVAVLSACSHSGLIERGIELFHSMSQNYGVNASQVHYTCMIDLLGRAGRFKEAQNLMKEMPFEPDAATWGALLAASRIHGNIELAEKAAEVIFEREPDNAGMYVLLSNLYAASRRWADVGKMRLKMRDKGVKKVPGYSWLEAQNKVHTFASGDLLHPEGNKVYSFLEDMDLKMKHDGYVPSTNLVLHEVEEEEKERILRHHSEKLAVAYGILTIPAGRPIRVIKNLRVCEDCHNAIKHMSKISGRLIILRDSHRFHHFDGGSCSCGDYW